jgi:hypothetical protein
MIRRVILFTIEKPTAVHLARMRACLTDTPYQVPGIVTSVVHDAKPINNSPVTLMWETVFADDAAIDRYSDHPYHTGPIRDLFTAVDFQVATAFIDA